MLGGCLDCGKAPSLIGLLPFTQAFFTTSGDRDPVSFRTSRDTRHCLGADRHGGLAHFPKAYLIDQL